MEGDRERKGQGWERYGEDSGLKVGQGMIIGGMGMEKGGEGWGRWKDYGRLSC